MSRIVWDDVGQRFYETGVDHVVLYPQEQGKYPKGAPWNGVTAITNSPSGAEPTPLYADNIKYVTMQSAEEFAFTIEAYTYPDEWYQCDGSEEVAPGVTIGQQNRKPFGLSYRTKIGNDTDGQDYGYKLHLIWGGLASPSEQGHQTVNDSPEATTFSWECSTTPVNVTDKKPTAHMEINSTLADPAKLAQLEAALYGTDEAEAYLPLPDEVIAMLSADAAA